MATACRVPTGNSFVSKFSRSFNTRTSVTSNAVSSVPAAAIICGRLAVIEYELFKRAHMVMIVQ